MNELVMRLWIAVAQVFDAIPGCAAFEDGSVLCGEYPSPWLVLGVPW